MGELSQSCKRISLRIQLLFDDVQSLTDAEQEQIMEIIRVRLDEWQALRGLDYPTEKLSEQADPNPTPPKMAKLTTNLQGRKENVRSQKPTPSISPTKPHTITTVTSHTLPKSPQTLTSLTPKTVDMHNNLVEMDSEPVDHNNQISNELDINSFGRDTSNSQDTSTLIDAIKQEYEDDDNDETDDVNYDSNFTDISIKTESDINNSIDQVKEEQIEDDNCVPPESLKKPTGKSKRKGYLRERQLGRGRPTANPPGRLVGGVHYLMPNPKRTSNNARSKPDCVVCSDRSMKRCQTTYMCRHCQLAMCPYPCFERYHTRMDFKVQCRPGLHNT